MGNLRWRQGRLALWSGIGLLLLFGFLAGYDYYLLNHSPTEYVADSKLLEELQTSQLHEVAPQAASIGDWPQWRGPRRDGVSLETGLLTSWPAEGLRVLWRTPCGEGYSALAIARGRAFTLSREEDHEVILCLDDATGKELWRHAYPAPCKLPYGNGPRSTPTIDDDRVYSVGATGILHCLRAANGEVVWREDLLQAFNADNLIRGTSSSTLVEGDLLLTNPGGPGGNSIVALDKRTGDKIWGALDDPPSYSSPIALTAAGVRQLIFFTGDGLVGLAPVDGTLLWRFPWLTHEGTHIATPIARDNYVFFSSGYQKGGALLKLVPDGQGVRAERVYQTRAMSNHFSTCVLYREHLYGCTEAGFLTCMNFRTGEVTWRVRGYGKGTALAADGHLVVLAETGRKLALIEANPERYTEKGLCRIPEQRCWTVPTLAHGRLYVRLEEEIICFDAASGADR